MKSIKPTKRNEWFRTVFLASFENCKGKQVSEKQGNIFKNYLKEEDDNWRHANASFYSGIIAGKMVRLQISGAYNGCTPGHTKTLYRDVFFVTITDDTTELEKKLRDEKTKLWKQWDYVFENGGSDEELDEIENKVDEIIKKLSELM